MNSLMLPVRFVLNGMHRFVRNRADQVFGYS
jgi:hypothetical protein